MKTILLISPGYNYPIWSEMYPNGALAQLSSVVKQSGHRAVCIQSIDSLDKIARAALLDLDYIGITFTTFQTKAVKELTSKLKKVFSIPIIAGGAHVSSVGEAVVDEFPDIDMFVAGEGESALVDILDGKSFPKFHRACRIENLDELPMPEYKNIDRYTGAPPPGPKPSMFIMASRGCPFQCIFCNKGVYGSKVRYKSPTKVVEEVKYLKSLGAKEIFFQDDTLNLNRDWLLEILDRIESEKLGLKFRAPFRANYELIDYDLLMRLKEVGFWLIFYGVESGDAEILRSVKKGLTLPEIERAFGLTHQAGIKTEASFIVGLPGETHQTVNKTWRFYKKLNPFWAGFSAPIPFPNTELSKNGIVLNRNYDEYRYGAPLMRTEELSAQEIVNYAQTFNKKVRKDKVLNILKGGQTIKWALNRVGDYRR